MTARVEKDSDATESETMAFAAANDYVVLTNDLDFAANEENVGPKDASDCE